MTTTVVQDLYTKLDLALNALNSIQSKDSLVLDSAQYRYELQSCINLAKTALLKIKEVK